VPGAHRHHTARHGGKQPAVERDRRGRVLPVADQARGPLRGRAQREVREGQGRAGLLGQGTVIDIRMCIRSVCPLV